MASGNSREGASASHPAPNFQTGMPIFVAEMNLPGTFAESAYCKTMISFVVSACQGESSPNLLRPEFRLLPRHEIHAATCAPRESRKRILCSLVTQRSEAHANLF